MGIRIRRVGVGITAGIAGAFLPMVVSSFLIMQGNDERSGRSSFAGPFVTTLRWPALPAQQVGRWLDPPNGGFPAMMTGGFLFYFALAYAACFVSRAGDRALGRAGWWTGSAAAGMIGASAPFLLVFCMSICSSHGPLYGTPLAPVIWVVDVPVDFAGYAILAVLPGLGEAVFPIAGFALYFGLVWSIRGLLRFIRGKKADREPAESPETV